MKKSKIKTPATTQYLDFLMNYFTINQEELIEITKKTVKNTKYISDELLAELYLYLAENQEKVDSLIEIENKDRMLMRYIAQWCYNQIRLYNSNPNMTNFKGKVDMLADKDNFKELDNSKAIDNEVYYINEEQLTNNELDINKTYPKLSTEQVEKTRKTLSTLSESNKVIYQLYVLDGLTGKQIAKQFNISTYSAYKLISEFKQQFN
jgi:RNA polymerase sigma factor (sigma-70 family)